MKLHLYLNREPLPETIAPGDILHDVQITPEGEFPHGDVMQHVTASAIRTMVDNWIDAGSKEILVDFDHDAETPDKSTQAAAWISNLHITDKGLVGDFKFTDVGAEAVSSRRFRFLSPCWDCRVDKYAISGGPDPANESDTPKEVTPVSLVSVALTNKPNLPVDPLLNRAPSGTSTVEQKENPNMDKIKEALGLPPEATEEDILAAIGGYKDQIARANAEKEDAEAESFAEEHKDVCNRDALPFTAIYHALNLIEVWYNIAHHDNEQHTKTNMKSRNEIRKGATAFSKRWKTFYAEAIIIPSVSSDLREYVPIGFINDSTLVSNSTFLVPDTMRYHFGVLTSRTHNAWTRAVAGILKFDYRYSQDIVYNDFVWPTCGDVIDVVLPSAGAALNGRVGSINPPLPCTIRSRCLRNTSRYTRSSTHVLTGVWPYPRERCRARRPPLQPLRRIRKGENRQKGIAMRFHA